MPVRIQCKRMKGWKMPENAVYVGRPTEFGNQFRVGRPVDHYGRGFTVISSAAEAVSLFRQQFDDLSGGIEAKDRRERVRSLLKGKDLACWCPLGHPCHADVLLEIANS